jgi:hypothetical protein
LIFLKHFFFKKVFSKYAEVNLKRFVKSRHFFETSHVFKKEYPELYANVFSMINFKEEYLR